MWKKTPQTTHAQRAKGGRGPRLSCTAWVAGGCRYPAITAERCEADWITTHYPTGWSTWDGPGRRKPDMRPGRAGWCRSPPRAVRTGERSHGRSTSTHASHRTHGGTAGRRTGEWRWRTQRCREDSSSHASSGMINTSTHTITHMKMPYSYTRQAPLLRFSEFRFTVYVSPSTNRKRDS
jgi:hypothetical protein